MRENIHIDGTGQKRVVILGGGFAGLSAARELERYNFQLVLIDKNNYHQFSPLLYQVACSALEDSSIIFPIRRAYRKKSHIFFMMAEVSRVDLDRRQIDTTKGRLDYDYLIIAAGSTSNYFGMQDIQSVSYPLKTITDALSLRNQIYKSLEFASCLQEEQREPYLNFVIAGGGPSGVELAGSLAELKNNVLHKDFPSIDFKKMKIILLNSSSRLLESFKPESSRRALSDLQSMGVLVTFHASVCSYNFEEKSVVYNQQEKIKTNTLIWTCGVRANHLSGIDQLGRGERMLTDSFLRVREDVFAIGDIGMIDQNPLPQVAQVAIQQGRYVARLIAGIEKAPFKYRDRGSMATIGRNKAIAEIGNRKIAGFFAWSLWLYIHITYMIGFRNKLLVLWDWVWNYILKDQPISAIIDEHEPEVKRE